jgi:hypothetical protein
MAHVYNPSYSRSRYQEDCGSKPAQAPYLKTQHKNRADGMAQGVGPEFKPQYLNK